MYGLQRYGQQYKIFRFASQQTACDNAATNPTPRQLSTSLDDS